MSNYVGDSRSSLVLLDSVILVWPRFGGEECQAGRRGGLLCVQLGRIHLVEHGWYGFWTT